MNARLADTGRFGVAGINVANLVLGIWLIFSPFVLGFAWHETAKWNNVVVGIAVALVALTRASVWNIGLGVWLIISPFALGFAGAQTPLWNNLILGVLVATVAYLGRTARPREYGHPPPV